MTQKEYKGRIDFLEAEIIRLNKELEESGLRLYNYETLLENYHLVNEELRREKDLNERNGYTIQEQRRIIERYEKILDKFTISYGG